MKKSGQYRAAIRAQMSATPALEQALHLLEEAGHPAHLVGGSVRDLLMGRASSDLDIATRATPDEVMAIFENAGASVHPTGIEHGTLTVVIDALPLEITTWRHDVTTDGRRATVAFADRLEDDALRRDFTINALYAARDGTVLDPTGIGLQDIANRRIRFIGRPEDRIREDHLRILRFFRFSASHAAGVAQGADLDACRRLNKSASSLPGERVGAEMLKLLVADGAPDALAAMKSAGLLEIVLPGVRADAAEIARRMERMIHAEASSGLVPCPLRRMAVLVEIAPRESLKLSRKQSEHIDGIIAIDAAKLAPEEMGYRHGVALSEDALLRRFALGCDTAIAADVLARVAHGARQQFPVRAKDLMPDFTGAALGQEIRRLERLWLDSGFAASRSCLLAA